jgi:threonine aldolase
MPKPLEERLRAAGARFYPWTTASLPAGLTVPLDATLVRLVTSFATTAGEVEDFLIATRAK